MELYKDHVIVMTKSGEFLKLRKRGTVNIGDIYKGNIYRRIPPAAYAAAAALIFACTSMAGYTAYANQIVGYVDIKGNKDVRLYVSRKGTVEKVDGVQNPGQMKDLPVYQAIEELNTIAPEEGIYNDNSEVEITTTEVKDSKLDFNKVNEDIKKILTKDNNSDKDSNNPSKEKTPGNPEKSNSDNNGKAKDDTTKQSDTNIDTNKDNGSEKDKSSDKNNNKNIQDSSKAKDTIKNTNSLDTKDKKDKKDSGKGTTKNFWNFWR